MSDSALRQQLLDTARAIGTQGLGHGSAGNVSVRVAGGFLVTPSALPYEECACEDMVFVDWDGEAQGRRRPSSEWRMHRDIYTTHQDAQAILHTHAPACTTLACLHKSIPAFHYMVALGGGEDIRCAPYASFGTEELSEHVLKALADRRACLLANHGMICFAGDLPSALTLALEIEDLAHIYCETLKIGAPQILSQEQMREVLEKFADYRRHGET